MSDQMILLLVFMAVLMAVYSIMSVATRRREVARNIARSQEERKADQNAELDDMLSSENANVRHYFEVSSKDHKDSLRMRLIRAGFFSPSALFAYNVIRIGIATGIFLLTVFAVTTLIPSTSYSAATIVAMVVSGISFIGMSFWLDKHGKAKEIAYRKLFPDFMDLIIVCVDAGLSFEAAIDRVAREFMVTNPDFGTHLGIIELEVRAGRPVNVAIANFADRTNMDEARSLAILFRQSEELGSSVSKTLRTFSSEMRQMRIIKAEEKANALPVKMVFPIALFMFPVNLVIVLVPMLVTIIEMLLTMTPPPGI